MDIFKSTFSTTKISSSLQKFYCLRTKIEEKFKLELLTTLNFLHLIAFSSNKTVFFNLQLKITHNQIV